ncbi:glucuronate isomerase [Aureibacillus halotolerans]|uniref:Glucuronate isomerase n=1 Tax=Aureibacillus halotolerans TaxID=1508390 RepID=A0A4R6UCZ7_9BACI|nr:glucuronate isomerase [Aureibacillus halotolerans]TDQ42929.1 hypothetical protein EV213_101359 [Aureibacillus halotolerans]
MTIQSKDQLETVVHEAIQKQPVTDMHTHLYSPNFGDILLWDIDELLTYHYLVAEVMRWTDITPEAFWELSKREQADLIWDELFIKHSPVSEACRGVLTCLQGLGLDPSTRDLNAYRAHFEKLTSEQAVANVLKAANVNHVVMTNDPFDDLERVSWEKGEKAEAPFHAALRIDPLLNQFEQSVPKLQGWGYKVDANWSEQTAAEVRRFLNDWIKRMDPVYMAVSLPPTFAFPEDSFRGKVIEECILPVSKENSLPFAMMIGVKKQVNPRLGDAGDYLGKASMDAVEHLLSHYPDNKFIVTMLSRENQHELVVLARKFSNLMIFGCWWFMNNPIIINEMTRMRMEMLGTSMIPQHSDARVLEQLVYKWSHSKQLIGDVLIDKYNDILQTGWTISEDEIKRDVADLFADNFWRFVGKEAKAKQNA